MQQVATAKESLSNVSILRNGATDELTPETLESLRSSILGLSKDQATLALSTQKLSQDELNLVLSSANLLNTKKELTAVTLAEQLANELNDKSTAESLLLSAGLVTQKELESNAVVKVTAEKINEAIANGTLTESQASVIASSLGISGVNVGEALTWDALTTSIWANVKALAAWLVTNPIGQIALIAGGIFGLVKAYDALHLSVEEATDKASESLSAYQESSSKLEELENQSENTKSSLEEMASKYNIELDGSETIDEIIDKLDNVETLSITDESDLNNLKAENEELKRQIELQEKVVSEDQKKSETDAKKALKLTDTKDLTTEKYNTGLYEYTYDKADIRTATKNEIARIAEINDEKLKLNEDYNKAKTQTEKDAINKQIESLDAENKKYREKVDEQIDTLNTLKDNFKDSSDPESQSIYKDINKIIDSYNNIDLSPLERNLKALDSFFDGSAESESIKNYLEDITNKREELIANLENEKQKITDWGLEEYSDDILNQTIQSKFGNVDMDKRKVITWSEEMKKTYKDALASWDYDPEVGGIDTVFGGSSRFGESVLEQGVEVAFTPIMDGKFLDQNTVYDYIEELVGEATTDGVFSEEKLLSLDKQGKQMGNTFVKGLIAAADEGLDYDNNGNWAETVGRLMHFSGDFGAISLAYKNIDKAAKKAGVTSEEFIDGLDESSSTSKVLENALASVGLTLEDLGLTGEESVETLAQYFDDLRTVINEVNEAADNFVPPTVEDVEGAFESANQGANYDSMVEKLKTAKEMADKGLYGTDDVQTMTQWILPNKIRDNSFGSKAYIDAWEKAYKKVNSWFNEEDPANGMWSFLDDLRNQNADLFSKYDKSKGLVEFSDQFENSAQAAKELGVNVDVVDTMLHKLQEYGFTFDDNFKFSGDMLNEYDSALSGIKEIYDSMADSDYKDELGIDIDKWNDEYNYLSDNLDELTEDKIIEIQFEYNLASLKADIAQLQQQWDNGDTSASTGAGLISEKISLRESLESKTGYDENIKDKGYKQSYKKINTLQSQFQNASEEDRIKLQEQISTMLDMQNTFQELRQSGKDINWDDFLNSKQAGKVFDDLIKKGNLSKEELSELFGIDGESIDVSIKAKVNADTKKAEKQLKKLEKGGTITYTANVDDVEQEVEAHKDENGVIHYTVETEDGETVNASKVTTTNSKGKEKIYYSTEIDSTNVEEKIDELNNGSTIQFTANLDGVDQQIEAYKDEEGTITYTEILTGEQVELDKYGNVTYLKAGQEEPEDKNAKVDYELGKQENPVMKSALVNYKIGSQEDPKTKQAKIKYVKEVTEKTTGSGKSPAPQLNGTGGFKGTAWLTGTAYAKGNVPSDAFTNPEYRTKNGELVLTGEEDQELVVHGNQWWTVGDKGAEFTHIPSDSIIFNAQQTKELLRKGFINSRGKARLHGTAYSGGFLPTGSSNTKTDSSSNTTKKNTPTNNNNNNDDKDNKTTKKTSWSKFEKWVDKLFDWIEIRLDKLAKKTERWTTLAENAVTYAGKALNYQNALSATKTEITANEKASTKYLSQAKTVGLKGAKAANIKNPSKWVNNILTDLQNGRLTDKNGNIKKNAIAKYGEKKSTIISDMNEWFQKSVDSKDKIQELTDSFASLYEELENLANNEAAESVEKIDHELDLLSTNYDLANSLEKRQSNLQEQNQKQLEQLNAYQKAYSSTSSSLEQSKSSLRRLGINADGVNGVDANDNMSTAQLEAVAKYNAALSANKEALQNVKTAQADYNKTIYDNAHQMFENIIDDFEWLQEKYEFTATRIKNAIDLNEAKGYRNSSIFYNSQLEQDKLKKSSLEEEYQSAQNKLLENIRSNPNYMNTDNYKEEIRALNDITTSLDEVNTEIAETQQAINELNWENFDKLQDAISRVSDEASFLIDELSRKDLTDSDIGGLTDEGQAVMALYAQQYGTAKKQAEMYAEEIKKVKEELNKEENKGNQTLIDHLNELEDSQRDYISSLGDTKDAMIDLATEGLQAQLDYLQDVIDKYKELMDKQEDAYEYQKNLNDAVKEINNIQKQLEVYSGDTSEENRAKIQQLNADLEDKQESLTDMQREKLTSDINDMFDDLMDNYGDYIEDLSENMDIHFNELIEAVNNGLSDTYTTINETASNLGYSISEETKSVQDGNDILSDVNRMIGSTGDSDSIVGKQQAIIDAANTNASNMITTIQTESNNLQKAINDAQAQATTSSSSSGGSTSGSSSGGSSGSSSTGQSQNQAELDRKNMQDEMIAKEFILDHLSIPEKGLKASSIKDPVKKAVFNSTGGKRYISEKDSDKLAKKLGVKENEPLYNRLKELGIFKWIKNNVQISGTSVIARFAKGSKKIPEDMIAEIGEKGKEMVYRSADGSILTPLGQGDMVFTHEMSQRLWDFAKNKSLSTVPIIQGLDDNGFVNTNNLYGKDVKIQIGDINLNGIENLDTFKKEFPGVFTDILKSTIKRDRSVQGLLMDSTVNKAFDKNFNSLSVNRW